MLNSWKNVNPLQEEIMREIGSWTKTQKTPISKEYIVKEFEKRSRKQITIVSALSTLLHKGYIRRAYGKKACYVQLKSV